MGYYEPYGMHNFMGLHANDAAALAYIQLRKWDSTKNGMGTPESSMTYFSTTLNTMRLYSLGIWTSFVAGAGIPTLAQVLVAGNTAGATTINMNTNKITSVAAATVAGDALCYGQSGAFLSGLDLMSQRITNLAAPSASTDACTKAYADQLIQGLSWQETVLDRAVDVPPILPGVGDRYIIGAAPAGAWVGHAQDITEWDGVAWVFTPERQGLACWVLDENTAYVWNGAAWVMLSALVLYTLDMVYDAGGAGLGRSITADSGAVDISVPVAVNGTALALHQIMPAATANVMTIENMGAGGASLELQGTRRLVQSSAADMTLGLVAADANAYTLHITSSNSGVGGTAGIGILAEDTVGIESSAGKTVIRGYNDAGTAVEIDSTLNAGGILIGCNATTSQIGIGTNGLRNIYVGSTGAASLQLVSLQTMLQVTANDALARTLTISATNVGVGGTALLDIDADDAITIDSLAAGISLDGVTACNLNSSAGTLTLGGVGVRLNGGAGVMDIDGQISTWDATSLTLTTSLQFDVNSTGAVTLDAAGVSVITIGGDANTGAISIGNSASARSVTVGSVDTTSALTLQSGTGAMTFTANGVFDVNSKGKVSIDSSSASIVIGGDVINQAVELGTAGVRPVTVGSVTGASNTTIQAGTGVLLLSGLGFINFVDAYKAAGGYAGDFHLALNAGEYTTFETNFGEVSLLNALNQCASSAVTLDEAYNAGTATIAVDAYDVTWNLTGAYSFVVDASGCTGVADGFQITNGTDFLSILNPALANKLVLTSEFETFDLNSARDVTIDSGTTVGVGTGAGGFTINTTQLVVDQATGFIGFGVAVPSWMVSLNGEANRVIGLERRTVANVLGKNLSIGAGGATLGATDKNGGMLILAGGISTGSGTSGFNLYAYPAGAPGVADNVPIAMIQGTAALLTLGDTTGATATTIQAGTGAMTFTAGGIWDVNATGAATIDSQSVVAIQGVVGVGIESSGGMIGIGADANAFAINIGTGGAARLITIGNTTAGTGLNVTTGATDGGMFVKGPIGGGSQFLAGGALEFGADASEAYIQCYNRTTWGAYALTLATNSTIVLTTTGLSSRFNSTGLGIGCTPLQRLNVQSGALRFDYVPTISAAGCTLAAGAAGPACTNGIHSIKITAVNALGETELGIVSPNYTVLAGEHIAVTNIPVSPDSTVTSRNVYMCRAGLAVYYLIAGLLPNNTATSCDIAVLDAALTVAGPTMNLTSGKIYAGTNLIGYANSAGDAVFGSNPSAVPIAGRTIIAGGYSGYLQLSSQTGSYTFLTANQYGVGIGATYPISGEHLVIRGDIVSVKFGAQRHPTANTAGNSLSLIAGGATLLATDKNGGPLYLKPGQATGIGTASSSMWATPMGAAGTTTNDPVQVLTCAALSGGAVGTTGVGILNTTPSAYLHLAAGTAAASTSPLKFTTGVLLTAPEAGAFEYDGSLLYYTDSTPTRWPLATGTALGLTSPTNMIRNGSAEDGLTYWAVANDVGSDGAISASAAEYYSGSYSLRFLRTAVVGWGSAFYNPLSSYLPSPYFNTALQYTLSFWAKSSVAGPYAVNVYISDLDGSDVVSNFGGLTFPTTWTRYSFTFAPLLAGVTPVLLFVPWSGDAASDVFVDNIMLTVGTQAMGYCGLQMDCDDNAHFNASLSVAGAIQASTGLNITGLGGFYNAANKFGIDVNGAVTRFYASGPDGATPGSYEFHVISSDGVPETLAMTINPSAQVGIGVAPSYQLDVDGGDINLAEGHYYRYGAGILAYAQTALHNYYFGSAGNLTTTGQYNTAVGNDAGLSLGAAANYNTFLGGNCGTWSTTGINNVFIGVSAGLGAAGVYVSSDNVGVGAEALLQIATGAQGNTSIGRAAGCNSSTGTYNVFVGMEAGYGSGGVYTGADHNVAVGYKAGYTLGNNADYNTLVGASAGETLAAGAADNTLIGHSAGCSYNGNQMTAVGRVALAFTTGIENTALGYFAGGYCTTGVGNLFVGYMSGYGHAGAAYTGANYNTCVGYKTGYDLDDGALNNTLIGALAGENLTTGDGNVLLGYSAGSAITTGSNKLYIANSNAGIGSALVVGDFATGYLGSGYDNAFAPSSFFDIEKLGTAKSIVDFLEITNTVNAADMDGTGTAILFNQFFYAIDFPEVATAGRIVCVTENDWTIGSRDAALAFHTCGGRTVDESLRITGAGNLIIGGTVQDGSAQGVLQLYTIQAPAAHVDGSIQIYSDDTSDAKATLCLMLEQSVEAIGVFTATNKLKIKIDNIEYWIQLDAV